VLPALFCYLQHNPRGQVTDENPLTLTTQVGMTLKEVEKLLIAATLKHTWHNVSASAKLLGSVRQGVTVVSPATAVWLLWVTACDRNSA